MVALAPVCEMGMGLTPIGTPTRLTKPGAKHSPPPTLTRVTVPLHVPARVTTAGGAVGPEPHEMLLTTSANTTLSDFRSAEARLGATERRLQHPARVRFDVAIVPE